MSAKKFILNIPVFISGKIITPIFERKTFRNNQHDWFGQWAGLEAKQNQETMNDQRITAREILEKHGIHELPADEVQDIIAAMKEIADKAWEAAGEYYVLEGKDRITFMKELFPEDNKDTSSSG